MFFKILILFAVGVVAGFINILAGGGSTLTLPVLIFLGLPPTVANGTNRVAILLQNIVAVKKFHEYKVLPLKFSVYVTLPATVGAILGAGFASYISDIIFKKVLAFIMLFIAVLTLANPASRLEKSKKNINWFVVAFMFLIVGFYGGFVQAGVGLLILSAMVLSGFDLLHANAVKVFVVMIFTVFALFIFTVKGKVDYMWGIILGLGNVTGAYIASVMAVKKGNEFIRKVVVGAIVIMAIKLLFS